MRNAELEEPNPIVLLKIEIGDKIYLVVVAAVKDDFRTGIIQIILVDIKQAHV